tara:strand:- start:1996 stop:2388 length:393 start_codon:yes stop_codon:yes gene_type:complete
MQTIQFIPCTEGYSGTSLKGSIEASYADLKEMFGKPAYEGIGDKITTEFVIDYQVSDGEGDRKYGSFSLYDWHFARNLNNDYEVTTWNVGGNDFDDTCAVDLAKDIFKETNESLVYAKLHDVPKDKEFFL